MAELFANNAIDRLAGPITSADTVITVTDASEFPATGTFRIRIDNELIRVDSVSGLNFTVTRGTEGTTAAAHQGAAQVTHVLTAEGLNQLIVSSGVDKTQLDTAIIGYTSVNKVEVEGSASGGTPQIRTVGADADIGLSIKAKGTDPITVSNDNGMGLVVTAAASSVNRILTRGAITANAPSVEADGSDTDIGIKILAKGAGETVVSGPNGDYFKIGFSPVPVVNRLVVVGTPSLTAPILSVEGTDTNIDLTLSGKGTGRPRVSLAPTDTTHITNKAYVDGLAAAQYARRTNPADYTSTTTGAFVIANLATITFNSGVDVVTNANAMTPTLAGLYQINGVVILGNGASTSDLLCAIFKNGVFYSTGNSFYQQVSGAFVRLVVSCIGTANGTTDRYDLRWFANGGGTKTIIANTFLDIARISAQ